ncbi:MAG: hypothetical protein GXP61_02765 [Epsilonproteobacteria bacterium]|nr:hypothetical protein [Campylobacterota bacterium]
MINTHGLKITFGRHNGEKFTRLPIGYLKWIINNVSDWAETAKAELDRRGIVIEQQVEISGHAIDKVSLRHINKWLARNNKKQGLHNWLHQKAWDAWCKALRDPEQRNKLTAGEKIQYDGMKFVFKEGLEHPILLTVM